MSEFEWKLFDHKWNNLKRWANAMAEKTDKPIMTVQSLLDMIDTCERLDNKRDEIILNAIFDDKTGEIKS